MMITQPITREDVVKLAKTMPVEKLVRWYEYGLFVLSQPLTVPASEPSDQDELRLAEEIAIWETASDEDWLKMEHLIAEEKTNGPW